jgi:hypothetical protein
MSHGSLANVIQPDRENKVLAEEEVVYLQIPGGGEIHHVRGRNLTLRQAAEGKPGCRNPYNRDRNASTRFSIASAASLS